MASASLDAIRARLAAAGLTTQDLWACADALERLPGTSASGRAPLRVALAGDLTLDFLARAVRCALAQEGELAQIHMAGFGTLRQACLDPGDALHAFRPDAVLLVPDWRMALPPLPPEASAAVVQSQIDEQVSAFEALWDALAPLGCVVIQHLLVPPALHGRGVAERVAPASIGRRIRALNEALLAAGAGRITLLEADRLAQDVGLAAWAPERYHLAGRLPFDPRHLPQYLPWFRGAWRSATGRMRKALVLDLDDTLWGGTIGDLGVEGIALGSAHGPRGEGFANWQAYLAGLAAQGVVLAVCSRNDPTLAEPGLAHPAGRLRRADFAAFVCRWDDKAAGLRQVAAELDLALDALVFADDNPAECALVRELLPEVAVVDLGSDPARFIEHLEAGHWFDAQALTAADRQRSASYAARAVLRVQASSPTDLATYLGGLGMIGRFEPARAEDLPRLAQMELKTNQFNLTTRRLSQAALADRLAQPDALVLALHLRDRLADHGLVGSMVAVVEGDALRIESWLLSCRVFARGAERFMLAGLLRLAQARGVARVLGEYHATARNGVVADLLARVGFTEEPGAPGRWWREVNRPVSDLACAIGEQAPAPQAVEPDPASSLALSERSSRRP